MNRQLLLNLNGNKIGQLKKFLDDFNGEPRIAWYPSAGSDFRPLLYLHPKFSELNPPSIQEPQPPDLFLFTDYYPWGNSNFLDNKEIYSSKKTKITIEHIEELPRLNLLPLHKELVQFQEGSLATDRVVFMRIAIESDRLGSFTYPIIYAFAENETFYCKKLIPQNAKISHIIHVRYGSGCGGGGWATGAWLLNVLKNLDTELFITDGRLLWQKGDEFALKFCSSIQRENGSRFTLIRNQRNGWATLSSGLGNYHSPTSDIFVKDGHVNWYLVKGQRMI
jgi:hypothetical protein